MLFLIARKGGEEYHRRHTSSARGAKLRAWFHEYGLLTVFVPAFVPVIPLPLKIFIISAGALEESPVTFSIVLLAARIPRYMFLAWLGSRLGADTIPYLRRAYLGTCSVGRGVVRGAVSCRANCAQLSNQQVETCRSRITRSGRYLRGEPISG